MRLKLLCALVLALGMVSTAVADDDLDAIKEKLVGTWHYTTTKPGKNERALVVEFGKDGEYTYVPPEKNLKVRKGTYKVTEKDTLEVEITEGLTKNEQKMAKSVKFTLKDGKLWFDPLLVLNTQKPPRETKNTEMTQFEPKKKK